MATRKRRTASASPQFLVVRGSGNKVLVGAVFSVLDGRKYARALDKLAASPEVKQATSAFIVEDERLLLQTFGGIFSPPTGPGK